MNLVQYEGKEIQLKPLDLRQLLEYVVEVESGVVQAKGIKIEADLCDCVIEGDEDLLTSLFYNLLDNAMKASEPGNRVWLQMGVQDAEVRVSVRDEGIGIPEEEIKKILEPFYMVDKSRSRSNGGAGLGLALCKEIIRIHRGELEIQSQKEKGSNFEVSFSVCETVEGWDEEV